MRPVHFLAADINLTYAYMTRHYTLSHTHTRTHTLSHTHTRTHTHSHTLTHTHTHTHTHHHTITLGPGAYNNSEVTSLASELTKKAP